LRESFFLHLRFTTRRKLVPSFALVFCLLCGAAEPLHQNFQNQTASPDRDLVAPRPVTAVSLGGSTKLKSGISFRKNRTQALAPDEAVGTVLQSSRLLSVTCNVRYLAADVTSGSGRSPPPSYLTI
jgi:hypothetical protein